MHHRRAGERATYSRTTTRRVPVVGEQIVEATGNEVRLDAPGQWGSRHLMPDGHRLMPEGRRP